MKLSGTKQFGLVAGNPSGYLASELAKKINSTTPEELPKLLAEACLKPKIFRTVYDTFVNDTVSDAKIKQQFLSHDVHPDSGDECVSIFKESLIYAGLAKTVETDKLQVLSAPIETPTGNDTETDEDEDQTEKLEDDVTDETKDNKGNKTDETTIARKNSTHSNVNVNIDIDPSMDPEKLEKLLKLLKNYGAI